MTRGDTKIAVLHLAARQLNMSSAIRTNVNSRIASLSRPNWNSLRSICNVIFYSLGIIIKYLVFKQLSNESSLNCYFNKASLTIAFYIAWKYCYLQSFTVRFSEMLETWGHVIKLSRFKRDEFENDSLFISAKHLFTETTSKAPVHIT